MGALPPTTITEVIEEIMAQPPHGRITQAVCNNALWCDTVCRAHDRPGEFLDAIWVNRHAAPRFYPNAVTLSAQGSAAQLERLHELVETGIPGAWGVKDSFSTLDLAPLGFRLLFDAAWLWWPASRPAPQSGSAGARWARVQAPSELADWERTWSGAPHEQPPRIFLPALLADADIAIVAAYRNERIVAGAIANRSGEVVGISNIFVPADDGERLRAGCVAAVQDAFAGLSIVGYELGQDLADMRTLGFDEIGPLRVWLRAEELVTRGRVT